MLSSLSRNSAQQYLGFDYGTKRIGVACGQSITATTTPLVTIKSTSTKPNWKKITELVEAWKPDAFVVGLPLDQEGSETDATSGAKKFARQLEQRFRRPVYLVNEAYSSIEAQRNSVERGNKHQGIDAEAAAIILQAWLDTDD